VSVKPTAKKKSVSKSKKTAEVAEVVEKVEMSAAEVEANKARVRVTQQDFINRLTEKLTHFDAQMILDAAMLTAGVNRPEGFFRKDEARDICLALIKRGGPAFSVGAGIYREVVG
jgi:hypothetical protein